MASQSLEQYQIGIVCALPKELKAVRAILDEEFGPIEYQDAQDHNSYVLGRIGRHKVVAAGLPSGDYGTTAAASVGKDMLRTFRQLRFGLLVGIGGGIPNLPEGRDIRLGDVVVSQPDMTCGGVVQYDLGKRSSAGHFERKGTLNKAPQSLRTALTSLKASLNGSLIPHYLMEIDQRYPILKQEGYYFPGFQRDKLRCSRCGTSPRLDECNDCEEGWIKRLERPNSNPVVHYGIIASGNTLLKNAYFRDKLRDDLRAQCVEMEAAGLDDFPCLVIRGICDYADADKNDVWQEYAALTAAAFAKQLLGHISPAVTVQEKPMLQTFAHQLDQHLQRQELYSIQQQIHNRRQEAFNQRQEAYYHDDKHRTCHRTFKTCDYESQKNVNPEMANGTCQWVLSHPKYRTWLESTRDDLLWISADPGCGKSVLSRSLVDSFSKQSDLIICYFFFKDNKEQDYLAAALCSILHQIFAQQPILIRNALTAWDESGDKVKYETHELWRILQKTAHDLEALPIFCVVDALDECRETDRAHLVKLLCQFHSSPNHTARDCGRLKMLVTSRPYYDIQHQFDQFPTDMPSIRLRGEDENDQIRDEINIVIVDRVGALAREFHLSKTKQEEIEQQLIAMEHRTYLWLYLALDDIRLTLIDSLQPENVSFSLLPPSVEAAYEKILRRISTSSQKQTVKTILTIIVAAQRPLTVSEMSLALGIATARTTPHCLADLTPTISIKQVQEKIKHWCGLFIFIKQTRLYLIHQTAKPFLLTNDWGAGGGDHEWKYCLRFHDVEQQMARIYVVFLCFTDFDGDRELDPNRQYKGRNPVSDSFFILAAQQWASCVRNIRPDIDTDMQKRMKTLYDESSSRFVRWARAMWESGAIETTGLQRDNLVSDEKRFGMNNVQLAAFNGHNHVLQYILAQTTQKSKIHHRDATGRTALTWASTRGHVKVVEILLRYGANVNSRDSHHGSALCGAVLGNHQEVVQTLISHGAVVNPEGGFRLSALNLASIRGHLEVVEILIRYGADVNARSTSGQSPIMSASQGGSLGVVKMLLGLGANPNARDGFESSALMLASEAGHVEIVNTLLEYKAEINAQGSYGRSALMLASGKGHFETVKLLLERGAEVNAKDWSGDSPLQSCIGFRVETGEGFFRCCAIVKILLDHGADVNARNISRRSALMLASKIGRVEIVNTLLEYKADINARDDVGRSPLILALREGHYPIAKILLDHGVEVNIQDSPELRSYSRLISKLQEGSLEASYTLP